MSEGKTPQARPASARRVPGARLRAPAIARQERGRKSLGRDAPGSRPGDAGNRRDSLFSYPRSVPPIDAGLPWWTAQAARTTGERWNRDPLCETGIPAAWCIGTKSRFRSNLKRLSFREVNPSPRGLPDVPQDSVEEPGAPPHRRGSRTPRRCRKRRQVPPYRAVESIRVAACRRRASCAAPVACADVLSRSAAASYRSTGL